MHYFNNHYSSSESKQHCTQTQDGSYTNCVSQISTPSYLTEVSFVKSQVCPTTLMPSPSKTTISLSNLWTSTIPLSGTNKSFPLATEISSKHTSEGSGTSSNDSSTRPTKIIVDNMSVIHCNWQGFLGSSRIRYDTGGHHNKLDKVHEIPTSSNLPNIFSITETKLGPSIDDKEIYIENYIIHKANRYRQGGGVAIYCHNILQPKQVIFPDLKSIEFVCVKISVARGRHVIVLLHLSTSQFT